MEEGKERRMEAMHAHNREQMQAALANGAGGFRKWASAGGCTSGSGFRGGGFHGELAHKWRWLGRR